MKWAERRAASQEERIQKWKEHFKNLPENSPEITDKPIKNYQLPTRHQTRTVYGERSWHRTEKIKSTKAAGLDEKSPELLKTRKFDDNSKEKSI